jgi:hypothetical protein
MIHNIAFKENWNRIKKRKHGWMIKSNSSGKKCCVSYKYKFGDQVLVEAIEIHRKISTPCTGLYPVMMIYNNRAIHIQRGIVSEKVIMCQKCPFQATSG